MDQNKYLIAKYLDEPERIVIFTIDEAVLIGLIMTIGIMADQMMIAMGISGVAILFYKRFKNKESSAFIQRYLYWFCNFGSTKFIQPAKIRKYKG